MSSTDPVDVVAARLKQHEAVQDDFAKFANLLPTILKDFSKQASKATGDQQWRDRNLRGHVFEVYVTNLLLAIADDTHEIDFVVPLWETIDAGDPPPNGFGKDRFGSPCLFHTGIPAMELDGVISIAGQLHVIEMKQEMNPQNDDVPDFLDRRQRVETLAGRETGIILITSSEHKVDAFRKEAGGNPLFSIIVLDGFQRFWNWIGTTGTSGLAPCPERPPATKTRHPQDVLPVKVDFVATVKRVSAAFFDASRDRAAFWSDAFVDFWTAGKFPVGIITRDTLSPYTTIPDGMKTLATLLDAATHCVVYLRVATGNVVFPELYVVSGREKIKLRFNIDKGSFVKEKRVNPHSYYFHEVGRFARAAKHLVMDRDRWEALTRRCAQLSGADRWVERLHAAITAINKVPAARGTGVTRGKKGRKAGKAEPAVGAHEAKATKPSRAGPRRGKARASPTGNHPPATCPVCGKTFPRGSRAMEQHRRNKHPS